MNMNLLLLAGPTEGDCTQGALFIDGEWECYTMEDAVREVAGQPVASWKIHGVTAIPANAPGHPYRITLENSPRFGPDTITVNDVPGFTDIRIHGGNRATDTEGCILVGDDLDWNDHTIHGAISDHVLEKLKVKIKAALAAGNEVRLDIDRT